MKKFSHMKRYNMKIILLVFMLHTITGYSQETTIDNHNLNDLLEFCDSTYADKVLILHRDSVIAYFQNPKCDSLYMNTASMVKSWTGLVVGNLVYRDLIDNVKDPVCKYLPEWKAGCKNNVTIEHLLTMTSGLAKMQPSESALVAKDINHFVLQLQPDRSPGLRFSYSNEGVQLLGILIEKVSGMTANEYFSKYLFHPLGMDSTALSRDRAGNDIVFGGCRTTIEDASKIGLLMLNKGKLHGQRIVSESWIDKSITPTKLVPYYGYLWWIDSGNDNYAAMGDFGQITIVFPKLKLLFLRQQSCKNNDGKYNMNWMGPEFLNKLSSIIKIKKDIYHDN